MSHDSKVCLAVAILEGRHFSPQSQYGDGTSQIIVEAKFGTESLETDPVAFTTRPRFDAELAFELDKKTLHHHRLQRTPIKLHCFEVNRRTGKKDIGYIILYLREARNNLSEPKWVDVLNIKFVKFRPQLLLKLYISSESDSKEQPRKFDVPSRTPKKDLKHRSESVQDQDVFILHQLVPKINSQEGYYQIGPDNARNQKYSLSVMLVFAENLSRFDDTPYGGKYFLWYSLLGNEVTTQEFENLNNPSFSLERASVKIHCTPEILCAYLEKEQNLEIKLYKKTGSLLASAKIPTINLFPNPNTDLTRPNTIEDIYEFLPRFDLHSNTSLNDSGRPIIGLAITLQKDVSDSLKVSRDEALSANSSSFSREPNFKRNKNGASDKHSDIHSLTSEEHSQSDKTVQDLESIDSEVVQAEENPEAKEEEHSVISLESEQTHCFNFTVDFRSLRLEPGVKPFRCFLRYSYPFFGTSEVFTTLPAVELKREDETIFPNGVCTFMFATTIQRLKATFREIPFIVELVEATETNGKPLECLVGIAKLMLSKLTESKPSKIVFNVNSTGTRREFSYTMPVIALSGSNLGHATVCMVLDDLGQSDLIPEQREIKVTPKEPEPPKEKPSDNPTEAFGKDDFPHIVTGNDVLQVAMELELWKEQQEAIFRKSLKGKEAMHLRLLGEEFKKRDLERESLFQKRSTRFEELENKLKRALADIELRERKTNEKDADFQIKTKNFGHKVKKLEEDAKDTVNRVKTEFQHKLNIERQRIEELEKDKKKLQKQCQDLEKHNKDLNDSVRALQKKLNQSPETKLATDVIILSKENENMKQRIEELLASKNRYKDYWGKALRQNALLQKEMQLAETRHLTSKLEQVKSLKIEEATNFEEALINTDRHILNKVKSDFQAVRQSILEKHLRLPDSSNMEKDPNKGLN